MGLFTTKCPSCGSRIQKKANNCTQCGAPAPTGTFTCGACGTANKGKAKFCVSCGQELAATLKTVYRNTWARQGDDFAIRIQDVDLKGALTKGLDVEHGTRALLFQKGKFLGELPEGRYDMGGLLKKVNHFLIDQNTTAVLVDAGDCTIDLENGALRTSDAFEVASRLRLVVRINNPDAMFVNLFKGRIKVAVDDLEAEVADEAQMLLAGIVTRLKSEDLLNTAGVRNQVEGQLRETLAVTLSRLGLELVQLRFIDFEGPAFRQLQEQRGQLNLEAAQADLTIERTQLNRRLRESLTQDKLDQFKNETDFEQFIRQTEHELGLKEIIRGNEMEELKACFAQKRNKQALLDQIEIESIQIVEQRKRVSDQASFERTEDVSAQQHRRTQETTELEHQQAMQGSLQRRELEQRLAQARNDAERRKIELEIQRLDHDEQMRRARVEHEQDMAEAKGGLELLGAQKDIEHTEAVRAQEVEAAQLQARSQATAEALMSVLDGPAADRVAQLEKLRAQQHMTPDQMLALAAEASPEAARALAVKYQADGALSQEKVQLMEQHLKDQQQAADAAADRLERVMQMALNQMGQVASAKAAGGDQTVVVPGSGPSGPTVVNPPSQDA